MARIVLSFDPFERKLSSSVEVPEEEYTAVYEEMRKRFAAFMAELFQGLPFDLRLVRDTPEEEP